MEAPTNMRGYQPRPVYPPVAGSVSEGWDAAVASLPRGPMVLAVEGPEMVDWPTVVERLGMALRTAGNELASCDTHEWLLPWPEIEARTASPLLPDDPDFATLTDADLADLLSIPVVVRPAAGVLLVHGPGAALAPHDVLWFADLPKRFAETAVNEGTGRNLGMPASHGRATTRRLYYTDWPIQDRHRDAVAPRVDRYFDAQDPANPGSIDGSSARDTRRPGPPPVSGRAAVPGRQLGRPLGPARPGDEPRREEHRYRLRPARAREQRAARRPGRAVDRGSLPAGGRPPSRAPAWPRGPGDVRHSFPIRFDYLDTIDGGNLSVHCHPMTDYMRHIFGWPYTQHENYYLMVNSPESRVFLGLHEGVDLEDFQQQARDAAQHGREFDILRFVQSHPATLHQLFAVPGGTPHGSGKGNVVLEVSGTPYLYSLRFYDWLRRDDVGGLRPVHVEHAFANLQGDHVGAGVTRDLIRPATRLRDGDGWIEEELSSLPEVFFEVRRLSLDAGATATDDSAGRFHILNVVAGAGIVIETDRGDTHDLAYAETIVIPASWALSALRRGRCARDGRQGAGPIALATRGLPRGGLASDGAIRHSALGSDAGLIGAAIACFARAHHPWQGPHLHAV